jgi:prepilin-type N-terminal cleavage/methylation domain-containing protein
VCSGPKRQGTTLLELIVVLALLGLILAIAGPAFIVPAVKPTADLGSTLGVARRAAVLRGEPVTVAIDERGDWRVDGDASPSAPPIATGTLAVSVGRLRVRVSPIGTCIPEPIDDVPLPDWNALGCALGPSPRASRP